LVSKVLGKHNSGIWNKASISLTKSVTMLPARLSVKRNMKEGKSTIQCLEHECQIIQNLIWHEHMLHQMAYMNTLICTSPKNACYKCKMWDSYVPILSIVTSPYKHCIVVFVRNSRIKALSCISYTLEGMFYMNQVWAV